MPKKIKVSIIGVGLIGGSLGMALKKHGGYSVTGIGRNLSKLKTAKRLKAVDDYSLDMLQGVKDADIVVICLPVNLIAGAVKTILPHLKPGSVITDVGSVKGSVVKEVDAVCSSLSPLPLTLHQVFIGGHPLAGTEKSGVEYAQKDLYNKACVVLTPGKYSNKKSELLVKKMWSDVNAKVITLSPEVHDKIVSVTSHLSHILAFSLSKQAGEIDKEFGRVNDIAAGSFKDMTRIVNSNPRDWAVICSSNKKQMEDSIDKMMGLLNYVRKNLGLPSKLEKYFSEAKLARQRILNIKS